MDDTISRQAVLDAIRRLPNAGIHWFVSAESVLKVVLNLPSAQPELIRCKDCKYNGECSIQFVANADDKFFCGEGERRQDG